MSSHFFVDIPINTQHPARAHAGKRFSPIRPGKTPQNHSPQRTLIVKRSIYIENHRFIFGNVRHGRISRRSLLIAAPGKHTRRAIYFFKS
jgi:hypothetical protein